jgi:FkbM family methyltransferase
VKQLIKSVFHAFGYDVAQRIAEPEQPFDVLRLVVAEHRAKVARFVLVQIGANDGVRNDPVHSLVVEHSLSGLMVEPQPHLFERLRENYAGCQGLSFERCAVAAHDGEAEMWRVKPNAPVPPWAHGLASFSRQHLSAAKFGLPGLEEHVERVTVPCLSLPTLFSKHGVAEVSLLQVDAEGYDCEIVIMALDLGIRPAIINYEFIHATPRRRATCRERLLAAGYAFVNVGRDTLAIRQS